MLQLEIKWIEKNYSNVKWEILSSSSESMSIDRDYRDINTPTNNENQALTMRVIIGNKEGISSSDDISAFKETFTSAVKIAKVSKSKKFLGEITSVVNSENIKLNFEEFNEKKLFNQLVDSTNYLDNKSKLTSLSIAKSISEINYQNYLGANITFKADIIGSNIEVGNNQRVGYGNIIGRTKYPDFKKMVDEAVNYYNLSKNNAKIEKGNYEVIFAHDAFNTILSPIKHSLNGDNVVEKKSIYEKKIGEQILSEKITIKDNPFNLFNIPLFDYEGNKSDNQEIVSKGMLKTFLHDNYTSRILKAKNNFHSSSMAVKPSTSFHNISITGKVNQEEIIKNTKKGFIFYDLYPGHTINNITGTFGLNSSLAFKIENGEIIGQCKGIVVTGNVYEMLKETISISKQKKTNIGSFELGMLKTKSDILI